ncbi:MAG TPA: cytochrome c-type biogenesis protein CcmH [Gaiellales bacterium]|nr:cytochrome c-type biogenesis protein CcmH [Gaiellales bacterium]
MTGLRARVALGVAVSMLALLAVPAAALACNGWTEPSMEQQLMCPVCHERLDQSYSPVADQIRSNLVHWCTQGYSADRVRSILVGQFGEVVLAAPPAQGFDLLAWLVPGAVLAAGALVAGGLVRAWSRGHGGGPDPPGRPAVDPALDARIDADLAGFDG